MVEKKVEFIAEVGINHLGSYELAENHIEKAVESGATTVKFQTYYSITRVGKDSPLLPILQACELELSCFKSLQEKCLSLGVDFCSTPFCPETAKYLESINVKKIKIASFCIRDKSLLDTVLESACLESLIVSTGVSTLGEIDDVYNYVRGTRPDIHLTLLHCISAYPIPTASDFNLCNISHFLSRYNDARIGLSDHSIGTDAASYAAILGAEVIEKHFSTDTSLEGGDHAMSASPEVFRSMVSKTLEASQMLGEMRSNEIFSVEKSILPLKR